MSFWIFVTIDFVIQDGYFGGTMRRLFTAELAALPKSVTRFGSDSRGRSVQAKPFAARNSSGRVEDRLRADVIADGDEERLLAGHPPVVGVLVAAARIGERHPAIEVLLARPGCRAPSCRRSGSG